MVPLHSHIPQTDFMTVALNEARQCRKFGEHPVGALIVQGETILSRSGNRTHQDTNPTHHAEIVVIGSASKHLGRKNLSDCILYTTHEPCPMCAAAGVYARLGGIVYGTSVDDAARFVQKYPQTIWRSIPVPLSTILQCAHAPHFLVVEGFMKEQCAALFDLLLTEPEPWQ